MSRKFILSRLPEPALSDFGAENLAKNKLLTATPCLLSAALKSATLNAILCYPLIARLESANTCAFDAPTNLSVGKNNAISHSEG